jgi:dTDP-4-amino-4,6-dideoxygalactose transaminase
VSSDLAILGGAPAFTAASGTQRAYFPSRERFVAAFAGIFERQYYTNQGPLTDELERRLAVLLDARHVICVTSGTIAVMMAAEALGITGKVVLPGGVPPAPAQALAWTGIEPVFCDVDPETLQATPALMAEALERTDGVSAILGINLWGGAGDPKGLGVLANARGLPLIFDSAHGFGCVVDGARPGRVGRAEAFSFGPGKIVTATEGGCVATDDDDLAARLRNIRSSYGAGRPVDVVRTANGRMSEAQAAVALLSLDDYEANQRRNARLFHAYVAGLQNVPGLRVVHPEGASVSNHHCIVALVDAVEFGLDAATLVDVLTAENAAVARLLANGLHRTLPWGTAEQPAVQLPGVDAVTARAIRLPVGAGVSAEAASRICEIIARAHRAASAISARRA